MKKCPTCKRTYADDGFTFCLEDGALLSPPYDGSKSDEPVSTIHSGGPPPTAVLPRTETGGHEVPPTVKISPRPSNPGEAKPQISGYPESPRSRSSLKYVVIGLVVLTIIVSGLGLGFYVLGTSNCPRLVITCGPSEPATYCSLAEDRSPQTFNYTDNKPISDALCSRSVILLQAAAPPEGVIDVSWSVSAGTIRTENQSQMMMIDTSGLAGKTIEVKAKVTSRSWFCSTTESTSFVVPALSRHRLVNPTYRVPG